MLQSTHGTTPSIVLNGKTGAGRLAGGNISWDGDGTVTFGPNVTLSWDKIINAPTIPDGVDDTYIKSVINDQYIKGTVDDSYIKGIVSDQYIKETFEEAIENDFATKITSDYITTGFINTLKITSLGTVTAGSFSLGNGNFIVSSTGNLTAKNADITGEINASSGTIGGFNIGSTYIGAGSNWNTGVSGMSLWDDFIVFNKPGRQALIGATSSLGFDFLGRFSDTTSQPYSTKTGVIINVTGGSKNNALNVTGDILLNGDMSLKGAIDGLSIKTRQISTTTYLTSEDVYVSCYNSSSITVYLPSSPVIGKVIFIRTINAAAVTINGNGKTINWGAGTGASRGVGEGVGDTVMLVYDGQFWLYNYMIR
jgi:hypothetical protein